MQETWRKVLWKQQQIPDNHVPECFLSSLRRNISVKKYEYWKIVEDMSVLPLNLSFVQIFVASFMGIYRGQLNPSVACYGALIHTCILGIFWANLDGGKRRTQTLKAAGLLTVIVRALSPVFLSLTKASSSDSIWHLTAWLCVIYIALASLPMSPLRHTRVMATNIALCATIVLASRLATAEHVFYFMLFNFQTFVLLPSAALWVHRTSSKMYALFVLEAFLVADILTWGFIDRQLAMACMGVQLVATFLVPKWFIALQIYKDQISGPWDPAKAVIDIVQ